MKVILLQQKPTKETIWHKLKELFAIRRRCKQIKPKFANNKAAQKAHHRAINRFGGMFHALSDVETAKSDTTQQRPCILARRDQSTGMAVPTPPPFATAAKSGQKLGWLKLPVLFCLLATTSFAGPWHCNDCITATFTGITFDGSPYGYFGSVNQEINLPLDVANSRPHYCSYHTPWPDHLPFPFPGPSVAHDHGVWRVFYNLYYSVDSPQCPGCYTAVGILQGYSAYHVIYNTQYPANGGQAEINACQ